MSWSWFHVVLLGVMLSLYLKESKVKGTASDLRNSIEGRRLETEQRPANEVERSIAFLTSELSQAKASLVAEKQKSTSLSNAIDSLRAESRELVSEQGSIVQENSMLKSELNETRALLISEKEAVASLRKTIALLQAEAGKLLDDLNNCKESLVCKVVSKGRIESELNESMKKKFDDLESSLCSRFDSLRVSIEEGRLKQVQCDAELLSKDNSIGLLKIRLEETEALLASETKKTEYQSNTINSLRSDIEECLSETTRYGYSSDSKEEAFGRPESEPNESKSDIRNDQEKDGSLSKAVDAFQLQLQDTNGLVESQTKANEKIPENNSFKAFASSDELYKAVDVYLSDNSPTSSVALRYGYPIGKWDVSQITYFFGLFYVSRNRKAAEFNEDLSEWDVSKGKDFGWMFLGASKFNSDLSAWEMLFAENTAGMFLEAESFNSDLSKWDVSNVTNMSRMFYDAKSFDGNIRNWNVSKVTDVQFMFGPNLKERLEEQTFSWDLSNALNKEKMFEPDYLEELLDAIALIIAFPFLWCFCKRLLELGQKLECQLGASLDSVDNVLFR